MAERLTDVSNPPYAALWKSSIWCIQLVSGFHPGRIWAATTQRSGRVDVVHTIPGV